MLSSRKKHIVVICLIIFLSFLFCLPFILPLNTIFVEESYLQFCSYLDNNLIHFAKDYKIPFWSYHFGGGYPFIKHSQNIVLSPLFYLLILPFGSGNGMKLFLLFSYAVGVAGFYLFVNKILKYSLFASAIASMLFIFTSFNAYPINTGNVSEQEWLYLPLITYTLVLSKKKRHYMFYCASLIVLVLLNGFSLALPSMLLFLLIFALSHDFPHLKNKIINRKSLLINFFLIVIIVFFLGAIKIFPIIELMQLNARIICDYHAAADEAMNFSSMIMSFFSKGPFVYDSGADGLGMGSVMYFGILPGILFIASCIFCFKKVWKYLLIMLIFICLSMAHNSPLDLFYILWHFPLFHSMHQVARYFSFPIVFMVPIIIGMFISSKLFTNLHKALKFVVYLIIIIGVLDMFVANTKYYKLASPHQDPIPPIQINNDFFNVRVIPGSVENIAICDNNKEWTGIYEEELREGLQYYLLRQNIGLINWYGNLNLGEYAFPKYKVISGCGDYWKNFKLEMSDNNGVFKNERYRGEGYFIDNNEGKINKVNNITWNTNEIIIDVEQKYPGILIINQNYDKDWNSNFGKVYKARGRLGIMLDKPATEDIVLLYRPKAFYLGLTVSIVAFVLCLGYFFIGKRTKIKG